MYKLIYTASLHVILNSNADKVPLTTYWRAKHKLHGLKMNKCFQYLYVIPSLHTAYLWCAELLSFTNLHFTATVSLISLGPYVIAVTCAVWNISNLERIYSQSFEHKLCDLFNVFSDCSSLSSSRVCASVNLETSENPQCCHEYNMEVWHQSLAGISFLVNVQYNYIHTVTIAFSCWTSQLEVFASHFQ